MSRRYNESKLEALRFLAEHGSATSREVAWHLQITHWGASSYLLKLHRQDLVGRERVQGPVGPSRERIYYLREKGLERLARLETQAQGEVFRPQWADDDTFRPRWA